MRSFSERDFILTIRKQGRLCQWRSREWKNEVLPHVNHVVGLTCTFNLACILIRACRIAHDVNVSLKDFPTFKFPLGVLS